MFCDVYARNPESIPFACIRPRTRFTHVHVASHHGVRVVNRRVAAEYNIAIDG